MTSVDAGSDALVGRLLDGRYQVTARLARGGMATVYLATDVRLDRPVAVKVMHPGLAEDHAFVERFIREARAAARLSHPHVVQVYDQGEDAGTVYLAMEYVPGRTLRDLLAERTRLSPTATLEILLPVLDALAAAHRAGVVHRDVKPENVLLGDDGAIKVADFGLARAASAVDGATQATSGVLIGTVAYLAPEQVASGRADARSDVYAAGILAFEMLTGVAPHTAETPLAVAYKHVHEAVPAPSTLVPGLPPAADELVLHATDRDPARRPADAAAMAREWRAARPLLAGAQSRDPRFADTMVVPREAATAAWVPAADARDTAPPGAPDPWAPPHGRRRRRGRTLVVVLVVALLAAGVTGVGWYLGRPHMVAVPSVLGRTAAAAEATLHKDGLAATLTPAQYSETVPAGLVLSQQPTPPATMHRGATVRLVLSRGPERHPVPVVVGQSLAAAQAALRAAHLAPGAATQAYSPTVPTGSVISSDPTSGTLLARDTAVALVVSKGPAPVAVPALVGVALATARSDLAALGLTSSVAAAVPSLSQPAGSVAGQTPAAGTALLPGQQVVLTPSSGPPLVRVPDVVGDDVGTATKTLHKLGLKVSVNNVLGGFFGLVRGQSPSGGTLPVGGTVTLTVI